MLARRQFAVRITPGWVLAALGALCFVPAAHADYAVLRNGQRLHITGYERLDDSVVLRMEGGSVSVSSADLVSIEAEDNFSVSAQKAAPVTPFDDQIRAAATATGLEPELIASVIAVESNFNPSAISSKSARGLMQLMPDTATKLAVHNVFDPQENINAGSRYLKELLGRYHQDLTLALAAYNAGPEAVDLYRGIPPFQETRDYVRRVIDKLRSTKQSDWTSGLAITLGGLK